ncbi:YacL family protein [Pseudoalteromonas xiamenensis]|uniref:YacL family protein n=1 Tax=Pseudoalteromonas xiamenensis TaxID=882626 RepID=A0A975DJ40_9GAMM|nr:YacL family protein [Pseudoalteromonas xiamenensis]QTH72677.1 YacL family protein [Pseudoalteromonas xiamenensis]
MEYQFIRDPLFGIRCKMTDEHVLVGRWLSDEIGPERVAEVVKWIELVEREPQTLVDMGSEIRLTLTRQEALLESHALFMDDESLLDAYRDDQLEFDEEGLVAACGFEDFKALIHDFSEFISKR